MKLNPEAWTYLRNFQQFRDFEITGEVAELKRGAKIILNPIAFVLLFRAIIVLNFHR